MLSRHAKLKQWFLLGTVRCEQKIANTHPNKYTPHEPTHPHTQTSNLDI